MRAAKPSLLSEFHELNLAGWAFERCQGPGPHDGLQHLPDLQNLVLQEILLFNAWLTEVKLHFLARNDPGEMDGGWRAAILAWAGDGTTPSGGFKPANIVPEASGGFVLFLAHRLGQFAAQAGQFLLNLPVFWKSPGYFAGVLLFSVNAFK